MEIILADEQVFHFIPQVTLEVAHDRVEQRKTGLVAGTVGALLTRPKAEEIQLLHVENRLEPFWLVEVAARTRYDRSRNFILNVSGSDVRSVTILGQELPAARGGKEATAVTISGTEHCMVEEQVSRTFDGISGQKAEVGKYLALPKTLIVDLEAFAPADVLVVAPQVRAAAVVRQVLTEVVKPVNNAQVIHEERVEVKAIDLHFRPVYAFEYEWKVKGKRTVVEFDGLTGEINGSGRRLGDQVKNLGGMLTRDLLFDVTADAVGMVVPGGSIAIKLVKAVVDREKK